MQIPRTMSHNDYLLIRHLPFHFLHEGSLTCNNLYPNAAWFPCPMSALSFSVSIIACVFTCILPFSDKYEPPLGLSVHGNLKNGNLPIICVTMRTLTAGVETLPTYDVDKSACWQVVTTTTVIYLRDIPKRRYPSGTVLESVFIAVRDDRSKVSHPNRLIEHTYVTDVKSAGSMLIMHSSDITAADTDNASMHYVCLYEIESEFGIFLWRMK